MEQKCGNCRFFNFVQKDHNDGRCGWCHRFPPSFEGGDSLEIASWTHPYVVETDWCGEWKEKRDA